MDKEKDNGWERTRAKGWGWVRCRELDLTARVIAVENSAEEEEKRGGGVCDQVAKCVRRVRGGGGGVALHLQGEQRQVHPDSGGGGWGHLSPWRPPQLGS